MNFCTIIVKRRNELKYVIHRKLKHVKVLLEEKNISMYSGRFQFLSGHSSNACTKQYKCVMRVGVPIKSVVDISLDWGNIICHSLFVSIISTYYSLKYYWQRHVSSCIVCNSSSLWHDSSLQSVNLRQRVAYTVGFYLFIFIFLIILLLSHKLVRVYF